MRQLHVELTFPPQTELVCGVRASGCLQVLFSRFGPSNEQAECRLTPSEERVLVSAALPSLMFTPRTCCKNPRLDKISGSKGTPAAFVLTGDSLISIFC